MKRIQSIYGRQLAGLIAEARYVEKLQRQVLRRLPAALAGHVAVAGTRADGSLVLLVDGAAWATQLRFFKDNLLRDWDSGATGIARPAGVVIRVRQQPLPPPPPRRMNLLSEENAGLVESVAQGVKDPALQAAMLRLAAHRQRD